MPLVSHQNAINQWNAYFDWVPSPKGAAQPAGPAVSLLYLAGQICTEKEALNANGIASLWAWLGLADWAGYAVAVLTSPQPNAYGADVATLPHDTKALLVFTGTMAVLYRAGTTDKADADSLNALFEWFPKRHHFVRYVWDGYFVLARQTRAALTPAVTALPEDADVPAVFELHHRAIFRCHAVTTADVRNSAAPVWTTLKRANSLTLQTRFVWHEFQMPALWRSGDRRDVCEDASSRFTPTYRNTDPVLPGKGLGWENVLRPLKLNNELHLAPTLKPRFYGLPGLLWAMATDAQLRRLRRMTDVKPPAQPAQPAPLPPTMTGHLLPIKNQAYISAVQSVVGPTTPANAARFSLQHAAAIAQPLEWHALSLDTDKALHEFDDQAQRHAWQLFDYPSLALGKWRSGAFAQAHADRGVAVVFCVSGDGPTDAWCAGTCDGWQTLPNGSSVFGDAMPLVPDDHILAKPDVDFSLASAQLIDLAQADLPGRYALFIHLRIVR